ncbi:flagellar biosynthesis anti-sigma factor FlgM [Oceanicoccus sp. KOV_DT_Chl]|uniref:flagellar biosynthesis anti-sigma factor FlgM n=1 Tax=Oceanicoccus sp. KOV_DT_Chl TaxID=1904639 RepID=UPI000C7CC190|nr:flagellar biosynthesis anti-sigma factor FlgM [Oceanicoccus sp. KOV_DT_Chl]
MVRDINGLGGFSGPQAKTEQSGKNTAKPTESSTPGSESVAPAADDVQLSSEAKSLQSLADKVNSLPEVNIERAEKIKAMLERGEYQVDDLVLADKILSSDALFGK